MLLHLEPNVITFRTLLHLGPNVITFRTLLHLGQLLHLGLQQTLGYLNPALNNPAQKYNNVSGNTPLIIFVNRSVVSTLNLVY